MCYACDMYCEISYFKNSQNKTITNLSTCNLFQMMFRISNAYYRKIKMVACVIFCVPELRLNRKKIQSQYLLVQTFVVHL